jgi:hypothetical protein
MRKRIHTKSSSPSRGWIEGIIEIRGYTETIAEMRAEITPKNFSA